MENGKIQIKASDIHKRFAGNVAYKDTILWDAYTPSQFHLFKQKINELFREPEVVNKESKKPTDFEDSGSNNEQKNAPDCSENSEQQENVGGNSSKPNASNQTPPTPSKAMEKIRLAVYNSTISQAKYTNKNLLTTFILVTVTNGTTYLQARDATTFSIHLVIRTRKCMKKDDSTNCCMVFIDEHGNVYKHWNHFIETNSLPEGVALAPPKGVYTFEDDNLLLDSWVTPASSFSHKAAKGADVAVGVGGFAASAATLSALATPLVVPALPVLGAVCVGAGAYSALRSGWQLWSRKDHEQSIALTDSQSRGAWLGLASGALSISSSIANNSLARLALAGKEVTSVRQVVVNGMNISTLLLSGTGAANGILDLILKYSDDEKISAFDVLQVAASLAIFTHSVYNFRLASKIVSQSQDSKVSSYRTELSNRQRKMFDKMTKETIRTHGASKGKMDVIRLINEVPDKQYLNDLNKVNKNLSKNNVRFTAGQNGQIYLNDEILVNSGDLRNNIQHGVGENILGKVTQPIPSSHQTIPNKKTVSDLTQHAFSENSNNLINYCQTFFQIASPLIFNGETFQDCIQNIIDNVGEEIASFLIKKAKQYYETIRPRVECFLKTTLYFELFLWDLYRKCEESLFEFTIENLECNIQNIIQELFTYYRERSFKNSETEVYQCDVCKGSYQICSI